MFTFAYGQGRGGWSPALPLPYGQPDCKIYVFFVGRLNLSCKLFTLVSPQVVDFFAIRLEIILIVLIAQAGGSCWWICRSSFPMTVESRGGGCHCLPLGPHRPIGNPSNTFNPPSSPNALPNFNFIYNFNFSRNPLPSTPLKTNLHNHYLGPANKYIQWEYLWTNQTAATLLLQMEWLYANRWTLLFRRLGISHHQ